MNQKIIIGLVAILFACFLQAQDGPSENPITPAEEKPLSALEVKELALSENFQEVLASADTDTRQVVNNNFVKNLVTALKIPNSYDHPFEKLQQDISIITSPDNAFRIFTWAIKLVDEEQPVIANMPSDKLLDPVTYRYYGAIQHNSPELVLTPLIDGSMTMITPEERVNSNKDWFGAIYYNIVAKEHEDKKIYTLFGWDGNNTTSSKKVAEVLTFNEENKPVFGAPIFEILRDSLVFHRNRFILEFKKNSGVTLNYKEDLDLIVYDYIAPEKPEARGNYNLYIPDGTYQGFKFEEGKWVPVAKVYNQVSTRPMQLSGADEEEEPAPKSKKKKKKKRKRRNG